MLLDDVTTKVHKTLWSLRRDGLCQNLTEEVDLKGQCSAGTNAALMEALELATVSDHPRRKESAILASFSSNDCRY